MSKFYYYGEPKLPGQILPPHVSTQKKQKSAGGMVIIDISRAMLLYYYCTTVYHQARGVKLRYSPFTYNSIIAEEEFVVWVAMVGKIPGDSVLTSVIY